MISAVSRFRVRNGMEGEARTAFLNGPHLVDQAPGFLGRETFTDVADPTLFYLVTRWSDVGSFRTWHSSPAHKESHQGIPKGLKLDADYTEVTILERLKDEQSPLDWTEIASDSAPFIARHLAADTRTLHCIASAPNGTIQACNTAVAERFGAPAEQLVGTEIWDRLTQPDAEQLRGRVERGERRSEEMFLLNFVDLEDHPFTLECRIDVQPTGFMVLGEPPRRHEEILQEQLILLNNQLAVISRENERKGKTLVRTKAKLEETLAELKSSYWHLKKVQEVMPICLECGQVRTGDAEWGEVVEYLKANALFLSHTYCPPCLEKLEAELDQIPEQE